MLHIFTLGHDAGDQLSRCLTLMGSQDVILLTDDGVFWAHDCEASAQLLDEFGSDTGGRQIAVLQADLSSRGLTLDSDLELPIFHAVDMNGFVELTEQHSQCLTWY